MERSAYDLSPQEAADLLGVHPGSLKRWVKEGRIPSFRTPGGWHRFARSDIEAFRSAHVEDAGADTTGDAA